MYDSINKTGPFVRVETGIYKPGDNNAVDYLVWKTGQFEPYMEYETAFVNGKSYKKGAPRELELIRGAVISDYQDYLEKEWIKKLRKKYSVKVNKDVLKNVKIKSSPN